MQTGKLRHYVNLQSSEDVPNEFGEIEKNWTAFASVWASIDPLSGRELLQYQQMNAELSHKIVIRYNSSVNTRCRLVFGQRIFDINVVKNLEERNIEQELLCKEAV